MSGQMSMMRRAQLRVAALGTAPEGSRSPVLDHLRARLGEDEAGRAMDNLRNGLRTRTQLEAAAAAFDVPVVYWFEEDEDNVRALATNLVAPAYAPVRNDAAASGVSP